MLRTYKGKRRTKAAKLFAANSVLCTTRERSTWPGINARQKKWGFHQRQRTTASLRSAVARTLYRARTSRKVHAAAIIAANFMEEGRSWPIKQNAYCYAAMRFGSSVFRCLREGNRYLAICNPAIWDSFHVAEVYAGGAISLHPKSELPLKVMYQNSNMWYRLVFTLYSFFCAIHEKHMSSGACMTPTTKRSGRVLQTFSGYFGRFPLFIAVPLFFQSVPKMFSMFKLLSYWTFSLRYAMNKTKREDTANT